MSQDAIIKALKAIGYITFVLCTIAGGALGYMLTINRYMIILGTLIGLIAGLIFCILNYFLAYMLENVKEINESLKK